MVKQVRKAVFPVAGLGTRFLPATKALPKEMLPIVDKPLIQYAVEEARAAGIEQMIFVTGRGKAIVEDHFDCSPELEDILEQRGKHALLERVRATTLAEGMVAATRQPRALGLGHAVWCARDLVGDEPFAVLLCDDLVLAERPCLAQMIDAHRETGGNLVAAMEVPAAQTDRYGILDVVRERGRLIEIRGMVEKPKQDIAPSRLAIIGRYVLDPKVFQYLGEGRQGAGGEIQLTDALARLVGEQPFHGFRFDGRRFDCGDKLGFLEANLAFALARPDLRDEVAQLLGNYARG